MEQLYWLYGGICAAGCGFSSQKAFVGFVRPHFTSALTVSDAIAGVERALCALSAGDCEVSSERIARDMLVCRDLKGIREALLALQSGGLDAPTDLQADLTFFLRVFADYGLDLSRPFLDVVEQFPPPFDHADWSAACPDSEDERRYGIRRGLYFRRDRMKPFATSALLAHELVHTISGARHPELLAMGLEEGLAELVGSLHLASLRLGPELTRNHFILARHSAPLGRLWALYLDHTRQAIAIYRRFGLTGVLELLRRGRKVIHEVESQLLAGELSQLDLPRGSWEPALDDLVDYVSLVYPSHFVLPPLWCYLAEYIREGLTVDHVCEIARVPSSIGLAALEEMSRETGLIVIADGIVGYSNSRFYVSQQKAGLPHCLRYSMDL